MYKRRDTPQQQQQAAAAGGAAASPDEMRCYNERSLIERKARFQFNSIQSSTIIIIIFHNSNRNTPITLANEKTASNNGKLCYKEQEQQRQWQRSL